MITRFVTSDDGVRIAVRIDGDEAQQPLLSVSPWATAAPADLLSADPHEPYRHRRFWLSYDRRGIAASQREVEDVGLEAQLRDVDAITRTFSLGQFDVTAYFEGAPVAIAYAARHPERVRRMVLWQPFANGADFLPQARVHSLVQLARSDWSLARRTLANLWIPRGPVEMQRKMALSFRERISADMFIRYLESMEHIDVRDEARGVKAQTLVLHPAAAGIPQHQAEEVAALIPNAILEHIEQTSSFVSSPEVAGRIIDFLDGNSAMRRGEGTSAGTAIILFADIVDSTAMTERMGDAAFRAKSRGLDGSLRTIIRDCGGAVIDAKTLGDGVLATFPAASQAIDAALRFEAAADAAGLQLHVGLHAGDVIREDGNVFGGAVNISARISALSAPGEVLVSDLVRGLARTSAGVTFEDRGEQSLKGIGEAVRVFAVRRSMDS